MSTTALDIRVASAPEVHRPSLARRLARPRTPGLLGLVFVAAAAGAAALAGETAIAWWALAMACPLVTPAALGYVVELGIYDGVYAPAVLGALGVLCGLVAFLWSLTAIDEL